MLSLPLRTCLTAASQRFHQKKHKSLIKTLEENWKEKTSFDAHKEKRAQRSFMSNVAVECEAKNYGEQHTASWDINRFIRL